jgi:hypothetical protein
MLESTSSRASSKAPARSSSSRNETSNRRHTPDRCHCSSRRHHVTPTRRIPSAKPARAIPKTTPTRSPANSGGHRPATCPDSESAARPAATTALPALTTHPRPATAPTPSTSSLATTDDEPVRRVPPGPCSFRNDLSGTTPRQQVRLCPPRPSRAPPRQSPCQRRCRGEPPPTGSRS